MQLKQNSGVPIYQQIADSFRTDIPEDEFMHVTVQTMMAACTHYAGGFIWGAEENKDYTPELLMLREMILEYVKL